MRRAFSKPTPDQATFETLMTTYRRARFEGLQLKTGQFMPWVDDPQGYLARWGDDQGRTSALIYFDTIDVAGQAKLAATIAFAQAVGSERVVFCHNHPRAGVTADDRADFARTLSALGADAADRGVALSLHHHYDQPVMHPDDVEQFFAAVEPGTLGLTVDTAHLAKSGVADIPGFIRRFAAVIDNVHLKDFDGDQWQLVGRGDLDLTGILTALRDTGYDGWLCIDEESSADLATGLSASSGWLDQHL